MTMPNKASVEVMLGIDVEEEGLFSGKYQTSKPPIKNIGCLERLRPFIKRGIKTTLFCAWPVFADQTAKSVISSLGTEHDIEIAAHLHYWNTPPLAAEVPEFLSRVPAGELELNLFEQKLKTLLQAASEFAGTPVTGFRMGRWDIHKAHWQILAANGIKRDASVRPWHYRQKGTGPDHFHAPSNPYWIETCPEILEVPLTVTPLNFFAAKNLCIFTAYLKATLPKWFLLTLLPVEHPLFLLCLETRLHVARGGRVLSVTWHSSEMMAGGSPALPTQKKVARFLAKMEAYFDWLEDNFNVRYVLLSGVTAPPKENFDGKNRAGDWHCQADSI